MFDMGFLELMVVAVIGLIVIGPEKLPGAIKTAAIWISAVRRNIANARAEFEKQIGADEIRREIHNEEVLANLRAAKAKTEEMRQQINSGNYTGVHNSDQENQETASPVASAPEPEPEDTDHEPGERPSKS